MTIQEQVMIVGQRVDSVEQYARQIDQNQQTTKAVVDAMHTDVEVLKDKVRELGEVQSVYMLQSLGVTVPANASDRMADIMAAHAGLLSPADGGEWANGLYYSDGTIVKRDGSLFVSDMSNISLANNAPEVAAEIWLPTENAYGEWGQPQGEFDAYRMGDKVIHNNVLWESLVDINTTEPGTEENDTWKQATTKKSSGPKSG